MMGQYHTIQYYWKSESWLRNRMLFLSGPRQVGKTTLVRKNLCQNDVSYFDWDNIKVRNAWRSDPDFFTYQNKSNAWICFDEIHKRSKWKDILKGIYDTYKNRYKFVVSGSARLEVFKKSGDSLVGRYFNTHLFPLNIGDFEKTNFTLPKIATQLIEKAADMADSKDLEILLELGGFPEPFFTGRNEFWKRWALQHSELIIREDIRDLSRIQELDKLEQLYMILKTSIGGPVNNSNIARDLEVSHKSIKRWLMELNKVQLMFPVSPFSKNIRRSILLEKKWYYMDWREAETNRFENYVASSMLRAVTLYQDRFGDRMSLHYIRTHDEQEIDFVLLRDHKPWMLMQVKEGKPDIASVDYRFSHELKIPCVIVTKLPGVFKKIIGSYGQIIYTISWSKLARLLP